MSDSDNSELNPLELLLRKHRKEKKELQAKLQVLKKSKGDKKKKKEVLDQIVNLESELNEKHTREIEQLNANKSENKSDNDVEIITNSLETTKIGKAQRRRIKKENEERERCERIRLQEEDNVHGVRNQEIDAIKKILMQRDLMIHEIPSDGNCLYCAILHQMPFCSVTDLRKRTANCMLEDPDSYLPYLTSKKTESIMSVEEYAEYCNEVATTTAWGGQVEVTALSHILQCPIEIIQATGPVILLGNEYQNNKKITLCYHRHMYRLGAHYNSVQKLEEPNDNEAEFQEPK